MNDSDLTLLSDDSDSGSFLISPKRLRPKSSENRTSGRSVSETPLPTLQKPICGRTSSYRFGEIDDLHRLTDSQYSYTYEQFTGSLLSIRLSAMQRSLLSIQSNGEHQLDGEEDHLDVSRLKNLAETTTTTAHRSRLSIPLDDHERQTDEEMLEFLTVPYMDLAPEDRPFIRPPSMVHRASSMILSKHQFNGPNMNVLETPTNFCGIPTPLPHQPVKGAKGQALFTTDLEEPFYIKTLNDVAGQIMGISKQEAQTRSFIELVSPSLREWLIAKIKGTDQEDKKRIRLSGDIIQLDKRLVSVWVEAPDTGVLIWVIGEVPSTRVEVPGSLSSPVLSSFKEFNSPLSIHKGIRRVSKPKDDTSLWENVYLQGENCLWRPQTIGSTVVIDGVSQRILSYNKASLSALLDVEGDELVSSPISNLLPQFPQFWSAISESCVTPGVVVSEHAFRRLVGIPLESSRFVSPHPSRDPSHSVVVKHKNFSAYVDLQVRVLSDNVLVLWVSYSQQVTVSSCDLLPQIVSVTTATPPLTPNRTPNRTPIQTPSRTPGYESPTISPGGSAVDLARTPRASSASLSTEEDIIHEDLKKVKVGSKRRELKIGSFETLQELGHGAYGEVKLVRTPSKRHVVALKSIYKDRILVDTWSRDRELGTIPNEIKILNQLRPFHHPNVVWMIDFFEDNKCYYLEMLPCGSPNAMDLFDFIETKSVNSSQVELRNIWQQIVSAVVHIHSMGIVHRDLKDENVIIDGHGVAKLIDFGSSAYVNQGPFDLFVGTVDYAAPEIIQGELYNGIPQDVWALGILLYTILFREVPFKDSNEIVSTEVHVSAPSLGDPLFKLILQKDPAARPTAKEILDMLA